MRVERNDSPFTNACEVGQVLRINMAHYEGNYFVEPKTLQRLEANGQVVMRFGPAVDESVDEFNPNGSIADIAAVSNEAGNVHGPDAASRACHAVRARLDRRSVCVRVAAACHRGSR